jgi:hypothetical protein
MYSYHHHIHASAGDGGAQTAIAIVAVMLALASLGWQVFTLVSGRPRPSVVANNDVTVRLGSSPHVPGEWSTYHITVGNSGGAAMTIEDVGFRTEDPSYQAISALRLRDEGHSIEGPELPCRIDAYDGKRWSIPGSVAAQRLPIGSQLRPWATVFARVSKRGTSERRIGRKTIEAHPASPIPTVNP